MTASSGDLSRRACLAGVLAACASLGARRAGAAARAATEQRPISGVHSVRWEASGELSIEQTGREQLSIEAEPAVLAKIVTEVREGRLSIRFAPGRVETREPIRFRLELKTLAALDAHGAGTLRLGPLDVPTLSLRLGGSDDLRLTRLTAHFLDARLDGSGDVTVDAGQVERQKILLRGSGRFDAPGLASREATAVIEGSGEIRLAVAERLDAAIAGSGDVLFVGQPRLVQNVTGAGEVRRLRPQEVSAQKP